MTTETSQDRTATPAPSSVGDAPQLPDQREHWRAPARFGSVPVEEYPIGWDTHRQFQKHYPRVDLPTQIVDRVSFSNVAAEPNRLIWGDNLHVMRQIESNSIDLIYMDPPFFSGRQYNVMWGDANEMRSFNDIWEGGMTGYLVWLNARLYEAKRLLKPTGSIYLHCDWHASHYIKVEMDKIFGYANFRNEIIWSYGGRGGKAVASRFPNNHDIIFSYSTSTDRKAVTHNRILEDIRYPIDELPTHVKLDNDGKPFKTAPRGHYTDQSVERLRREGRIYDTRNGNVRIKYFLEHDGQFAIDKKLVGDVWESIPDMMHSPISERIGYPTQKPEALLDRIIRSSSNIDDIVADFVMGGGHHVCGRPETRATIYRLRPVSRRGCRHRRTPQATSRYWRVWRFPSARLHR